MMSGFLDLVKERRSVRRYLPYSVEKEKLERCLEAARLAPSACNAQPWKFIVVDEPDLRSKVAKETFDSVLSFNRFVPQAPVLIVLVTEKPNITSQIGSVLKNREFNLIDVGIAAEHFCLQAADEGLGTCMLGWFNEKKIKRLLHVPAGKRIGLMITLGYPDPSESKKRVRKPFEKIVSNNKY
jgi:nitroreductase